MLLVYVNTALCPARGPDNSHVGLMICAWAASPTRISRGLRAHQRVSTHIQGLTCEPETWLLGRERSGPQSPMCPRETHAHGKPADARASSSRSRGRPKRRPPHPQQPFFAVFWRGGLYFGHHTAQSGCPGGGNGSIRATTRRRHAATAPLMLQNPHTAPASGTTAPDSEAQASKEIGRTTTRGVANSSLATPLLGLF